MAEDTEEPTAEEKAEGAARFTGGADEGQALLRALKSPQPIPALTQKENQLFTELLTHAAESNDDAAIERLQSIADNPFAIRELLSQFPEFVQS